jgi:hypothetical protein
VRAGRGPVWRPAGRRVWSCRGGEGRIQPKDRPITRRVHLSTGFFCVVSAIVALLTKKGRFLHRISGTVYFLASWDAASVLMASS